MHIVSDGTHDLLVPIGTATSFWDKLSDVRRKWDAQDNEETNSTKQVVNDVCVDLPYTRHAFNILTSPMSLALSDSILIFLDSCFDAQLVLLR